MASNTKSFQGLQGPLDSLDQLRLQGLAAETLREDSQTLLRNIRERNEQRPVSHHCLKHGAH